MRFIQMLFIATVMYSVEENQLVEVDMGASNNIEYRLLRHPEQPDNLYVRLYNRTDKDIKLTYTLIPGVGDGLGDMDKYAIIPKNATWPIVGPGIVKCSFKKPGIRMKDIEVGRISEEEGVYYDNQGNETYSRIIKFKSNKDIEADKNQQTTNQSPK